MPINPVFDEEWLTSLDMIMNKTVPLPSILRRQPPPHSSPQRVTVACFLPSHPALLVGFEWGQVALWYLPGDATHLKPFFPLGQHLGPVTAVEDMARLAWRGRNRLVCSGGSDGTLRIFTYEAASLKSLNERDFLIQTIAAHRGNITGIACVGECLVTSGNDGCVKIWRIQPHREISFHPWFELQCTLVDIVGWVRCLHYTPSPYVNGRNLLLVGCDEGRVVAWDVQLSPVTGMVTGIELVRLGGEGGVGVVSTKKKDEGPKGPIGSQASIGSVPPTPQPPPPPQALPFTRPPVSALNEGAFSSRLLRSGQTAVLLRAASILSTSTHPAASRSGPSYSHHSPSTHSGATTAFWASFHPPSPHDPPPMVNTSVERSVLSLLVLPHLHRLVVTLLDDTCRVYDTNSGQLTHQLTSRINNPFVSISADEEKSQLFLFDRSGVLSIYDLNQKRLIATKVVGEEGDASVRVVWREGKGKRDEHGNEERQDGDEEDEEDWSSEEDTKAARIEQTAMSLVMRAMRRLKMQIRDKSSFEPTYTTSESLLIVSGSGFATWQIFRGLEFTVIPGEHDAAVACLCNSLDAWTEFAEIAPPAPNRRYALDVQYPNLDRVYLFSISITGTIRSWDPFDMTKIHEVKLLGDQDVECLTFYPYTHHLVVGTDKGELILIHLDTGRQKRLDASMHNGKNIHAVTFAYQRSFGVQMRDPGLMISGGVGGKMVFWEMHGEENTLAGAVHVVGVIQDAHKGADITALVHEPFTNMLISGASDGSVILFNTATRERIGTVTAAGLSEVKCLALFKSYLLVGRGDGALEIHRLYDERARDYLASGGGWEAGLNGGGPDVPRRRKSRVSSPTSRPSSRPPSRPSSRPSSPTPRPSSPTPRTSSRPPSRPTSPNLADIAAATAARSAPPGTTEQMLHARRLVAFVRATLAMPPSQRRPRRIAAQDGALTALCLLRPTRQVATAGLDGRVCVFDIDTGDKQREFTSHRDELTSLTWRADSNDLIAGTTRGRLILFSLDR